MDLYSKEEAKLMDTLMTHATSGLTISSYEIERYNINITDVDYIQHLIDLIVNYSNKHDGIVNVFDRGTTYQSFESNFKTIRFNSEGGFEGCLKRLPLKKTNSLKINKNKNRIFISHSSKDSVLVNKFIDVILILGMGLLRKNIFCTSKYGTDIKTGNDFKKVIKEELEGCVAVIQIITKNYKESGVCMNEMGAAWVLCDIVIPIVAHPFDYDVGFINHNTVQLKLNSNEHLIKMYNDFNKNIFKNHVDINELNRHISEFISWINSFENAVSDADLTKNKIKKVNKRVEVTFMDGSQEIDATIPFQQVFTHVRQKIVPVYGSLHSFGNYFDGIGFEGKSPFDLKINHSFFCFSIRIKNCGDEPIEDFKIKLSFDGEFQNIDTVNIGSGGALVPSAFNYDYNITINEKEKTGIFTPKRKTLVGHDEIETDEIEIKPLHQGTDLIINWKLLSKDYRDEGKLRLKLIPEIKTINRDRLDEDPLKIGIIKGKIEDYITIKKQ